MENQDITYKIIGAAMEVHRNLGPGFLEAVYQEALCVELARIGIKYQKEYPLKVYYKGTLLSKEYYVDIICEDYVVLELKAVSSITKEHFSQTLNYLKCTKKEIGLLINFGSSSLQYKRVANNCNQ